MGWLAEKEKAGFFSICTQNPNIYCMSLYNTYHVHKHLGKDSDYFSVSQLSLDATAVQQYSAAPFRHTYPLWSGCTNEDIAEQYEQAGPAEPEKGQ